MSSFTLETDSEQTSTVKFLLHPETRQLSPLTVKSTPVMKRFSAWSCLDVSNNHTKFELNQVRTFPAPLWPWYQVMVWSGHQNWSGFDCPVEAITMKSWSYLRSFWNKANMIVFLPQTTSLQTDRGTLIITQTHFSCESKGHAFHSEKARPSVQFTSPTFPWKVKNQQENCPRTCTRFLGHHVFKHVWEASSPMMPRHVLTCTDDVHNSNSGIFLD